MNSQSDNADIAVLQSQMAQVLTSLTAISTQITNMTQNFVPRSEFNEFKSKYWLSHTMTAGVSGIVTALVYFFVTKGHP